MNNQCMNDVSRLEESSAGSKGASACGRVWSIILAGGNGEWNTMIVVSKAHTLLVFTSNNRSKMWVAASAPTHMVYCFPLNMVLVPFQTCSQSVPI